MMEEKIIKALEEECGTALFVRTKEGLIPTESGKNNAMLLKIHF